MSKQEQQYGVPSVQNQQHNQHNQHDQHNVAQARPAYTNNNLPTVLILLGSSPEGIANAPLQMRVTQLGAKVMLPSGFLDKAAVMDSFALGLWTVEPTKGTANRAGSSNYMVKSKTSSSIIAFINDCPYDLEILRHILVRLVSQQLEIKLTALEQASILKDELTTARAARANGVSEPTGSAVHNTLEGVSVADLKAMSEEDVRALTTSDKMFRTKAINKADKADKTLDATVDASDDFAGAVIDAIDGIVYSGVEEGYPNVKSTGESIIENQPVAEDSTETPTLVREGHTAKEALEILNDAVHLTSLPEAEVENYRNLLGNLGIAPLLDQQIEKVNALLQS